VHPKNNLIYIQQDATLHSLFHLETALYVSGGITTHHQERKQLYLQLPATTNVCKTRGWNYSFWAPDDERCVARNMLCN